jgi:hypothetical protein
MIKNSQRRAGSAHIVIIVILAIAIIGALGFVAWKNFLSPHDSRPAIKVSQTKGSKCENDVVEKNGTFCSEEIGIKLKVPTVFDGKFEKTSNYEIFKGTVDYTTRTSAGHSDIVYSAVITGNDEFTFTIAKEPLRSGYVDVDHMLRSTYYDTKTGLLSLTTSPIRNYSSTTDSYVTSGEYAVADTVPSFVVNGVKFYHGSDRDAGARYETYFAIVNGSIVKIKLTHGGYIGPEENDPSTIDADQVFSELNNAIKSVELIL